MGQPKLLMPWGDSTVIDHVLAAWTKSRVDEVVVVIRASDEILAHACACWPVNVVRSENPPDMKASFIAGIEFLETSRNLSSRDACLFAPADIPTLSARVVNRILDAPIERTKITVPRFGERVGHPVLFPGTVISKIRNLSDDQGLNVLVEQLDRTEIDLAQELHIKDIDTPDDYESLRSQCGLINDS